MASKTLVSSFFCLLLFCLVFSYTTLAEEEEEEGKNIEDYLDKEKIKDFRKLENEGKNKIFEDASNEEKKELLELMTKDIYLEKAFDAGGYLNEKMQLLSAEGQIDSRYPNLLEFDEESLKDIKFYSKENNVIGDKEGNTFLNLEDIPSKFTKVSYLDKNKGNGRSNFLLENGEGDKLILMNGSITENGSLNCIASQDNMIGSEEFSSKISDYDIEGTVKINKRGIVLKDKDSWVKYKDFEFHSARDDDKKDSGVFFYEDGVQLLGTSVLKMDKYFVEPKDPKKAFKVVLGDDWSYFLDSDLSKEITFNDYLGMRGTFREHYKPLEMRAILDDEGKISGFKKGDDTLDFENIENSKSITENDLYKWMSPEMKKIATSAAYSYDLRDGMDTGEFAKRLYKVSALRENNQELYKQMFSNTDFSKVKSGVAISTKDANGKRNLFSNTNEVDAFVVVNSGLNRMYFNSDAENKLSLKMNPSNIDEAEDVGFKFGGEQNIEKYGTADFGHGIDEIYSLDNEGNFKLADVQQITPEGKEEDAKSVTILNTKISPLENQFTLNNRPFDINHQSSSLESYTEALDKGINTIRKGSHDLDKLIGIYEEGLGLYDNRITPEMRKKIEADINKELKKLRNDPNYPKELKNFLPPGSFTMPTSEGLYPEKENMEYLGNAFLSDLREDIERYRKRPVVMDTTMRIDREDAIKLQDMDANEIPEAMSRESYEVDVGIEIPESRVFERLSKLTFTGSKAEDMAEKVKKYKEDIFVNEFTQGYLGSHIGESREIPREAVHLFGAISVGGGEERFRLYEEEINDLSEAMSGAIDKVTNPGESHIRITTDPSDDTADLQIIDNNGEQHDIDLKPRTKKMLKEALDASFAVPHSDYKGQRYLTENIPVLPNEAYSSFCSSIGIKPTVCNSGIGTRLKNFNLEYNEIKSDANILDKLKPY